MNGKAGDTYANLNWPIVEQRLAFSHCESSELVN